MSNNSKDLIRSMAIIGSSQSINIIISVFRMKAMAVLLGPIGIGLFGIFNNLLSAVKTAAGLGIGKSGVRQIAISKGDHQVLSQVRKVLLIAHLIQGTIAMAAVWIFKSKISSWLFGDNLYSFEVGLIGVAIVLTLISTAQNTLLQGMRRIDDIGRLTVYGAAASTIIGLIFIFIFGIKGVISFILIQPLTMILIALRYIKRLPKPDNGFIGLLDIWNTWKPMAKLGVAFMLSGISTTLTLLLIRGNVTQELGLEATGLFSAAWGISMVYGGLMLGAMSSEYYPRLAEVIDNQKASSKLINDQMQLLLAIGGPILYVLIALAPWILIALYSAEFKSASDLLQWMIVGNIFKFASWPLSYSLIAASRSATFFFVEISFNAVFLFLTWFFIPNLGLEVVGLALLLGHIVYFLFLLIITTFLGNFIWEKLSIILFSLHTIIGFFLLWLVLTFQVIGVTISLLLAFILGLYGLRIVLIKIETRGKLSKILTNFFILVRWPLKSKSN